MMDGRVALAVCTHRRPEGLERLLASIEALDLGGLDPSRLLLIVVDNDAQGSARSRVDTWRDRLHFAVRYVVEPVRGLAAARNAALDAAADVDLLLFVDDDEWVESAWLLEMLSAMRRHAAPFVIGPVRPVFQDRVPSYLIGSGLYHRHEPDDGASLSLGNTGNACLDMGHVRRIGLRFRSDFSHSGGEDACFFAELSRGAAPGRFAAAAVVHEPVAPERLSIAWLLHRRFRFGTTEVMQARIVTGRSSVGARYLLLGLARLSAAGLAVPVILPFSRARALRYACAGARGVGYLAGVLGLNAREY